MIIGYRTKTEALQPLMALLDDFLLTSAEVREHLRFSADHLSNLRKKGQGPTWIKLPTGAIRYRASEVMAWQIAGEQGELTVERAALAIAACSSVPEAQRAAIIAHLRKTFA